MLSSTASTPWGSAAVAHSACAHTIAPTQRTADSAVAECVQSHDSPESTAIGCSALRGFRQWHWPGLALSAALARRYVKASNIATGESQLRYALAYRAALARAALVRAALARAALARAALARLLAYRVALARSLAYRAALARRHWPVLWCTVRHTVETVAPLLYKRLLLPVGV